MITAEKLRELKSMHPEVPVVCYVNSSAAVKAECDICCTSSNAIKVVNSLETDEVIFAPDQCLGAWVQRHSAKHLILWRGWCPTHHRILAEHIKIARLEHPDAEVIVHPECTMDVLNQAEHVLSTSGMLKAVMDSKAKSFIIGTEEGLLHRLRLKNPDKTFYPVEPPIVCPNMKKTTLEKVLWSLQDMQHVVEVPADIAARARVAIERMIMIQ
jgi:quinolinate synthase